MDFDAQKMEELLEITRENNKILRSMRSAQRRGSLFQLVYWMIILGSIFGVYYYFQPTIQKYTKTIKASVEVLQKFESAVGSIPTDLQAAKNLIGR